METYVMFTGKSFIELVQYLFTLEDAHSFLSQRVSQESTEKYFGCQRQRGSVHDNPNVEEFSKNAQAIRIVDSDTRAPLKGNCRGGRQDVEDKENCESLPKCPRKALKAPEI